MDELLERIEYELVACATDDTEALANLDALRERIEARALILLLDMGEYSHVH